MSTEIVIASYTAVIVRGAIFQPEFIFEDENGVPDATSSADFIVIPNGAAGFSWTQGNGFFLNTGVGRYMLNLVEADTAALTGWSSGRYQISVVESTGFTNPCVVEGLIFVKDC